MTTKRNRKQGPQRVTLSLSECTIEILDDFKSIIKKPSGEEGNRSTSARFLISLGAKLVKLNSFHSVLQAGTDLSAILKELSYVPQNTLKVSGSQHKS